MIAHWPKGIRAEARGKLRHNPAHLIDVTPTVLDLAGVERAAAEDGRPVPPMVGKSLKPVFDRDGTVARPYLWWLHEDNRALRMGDWKIVAAGADSPWELYNLSQDRGEMRNLASELPDKVRELDQTWKTALDEFRAVATQNSP